MMNENGNENPADTIPGIIARGERERGLTLIEILVAVGIFAFVAMGSAITVLKSAQYRRQTFEMYLLTSGLRDLTAEMQDVANRPESMTADEGIGGIFHRYNGKTFPIANLPAGQIAVSCESDEATVPAAFGGPQDLNFDGDALDNLGGIAEGLDLKLVPVTLTASYDSDGVTVTRVIHRLVARTGN